MAKLKDIIGVEEKKCPKCGKTEWENDYDLKKCSCGSLMTYEEAGYNSLASAEVVVDREKLWQYLWRETSIASQKDSKEIAQAIATAIESSSIISLKEKE